MNDHTGKVAATVIPRTEKERYVLAAKRNDNKKWEFPGGKQHRNETLPETAEREIKEELNLEIQATEAKPENSWKSGDYTIIPVYAQHSYKDLETVLEKPDITDHTEYTWLDTQNLGNNLKNARQKLGDEIKALEAYELI
ncbi:MAG: NUDIX domain-containing protein [Candidatus Nanohaloarchaea archaeon]